MPPSISEKVSHLPHFSGTVITFPSGTGRETGPTDITPSVLILNVSSSVLEKSALITAFCGIFEKNSTRTANATFKAANYLGMQYFYNGPTGSNMGSKESVADTAKVFTEMYDIALFRTFGQDKIDDYAKNSKIPLINGLSDQEHPTQTIADLQTIKEAFGSFKGLKVVFAGDYKNNMGHS